MRQAGLLIILFFYCLPSNSMSLIFRLPMANRKKASLTQKKQKIEIELIEFTKKVYNEPNNNSLSSPFHFDFNAPITEVLLDSLCQLHASDSDKAKLIIDQFKKERFIDIASFIFNNPTYQKKSMPTYNIPLILQLLAKEDIVLLHLGYGLLAQLLSPTKNIFEHTNYYAWNANELFERKQEVISYIFEQATLSVENIYAIMQEGVFQSLISFPIKSNIYEPLILDKTKPIEFRLNIIRNYLNEFDSEDNESIKYIHQLFKDEDLVFITQVQEILSFG